MIPGAWHTILNDEGQDQQTVPVNGRHLIQVVGHVDLDGFTSVRDCLKRITGPGDAPL